MFFHRLAVFLLFVILGSLACASAEPKEVLTTAPPKGVIRVSGSGTALPLVQKLAEAYRRTHPDERFEFLPGTNSGGAIRGVSEGTLELAVTNRVLSSAEAEKQLKYVPFARDAVVFSANLPQPLAGLTLRQLQDVFAGRITDWEQLGGPSGVIRVLDRDPEESMRQLVLLPMMNGVTVEARTIVLTSARDMLMALQNTPNAIGYTSLGLFRIQQPRGAQVLTLDGTVPNAESVMQGKYPWHLVFGLVHGTDAPQEVLGFIEFVHSAAGHDVLAEYGYIPLAR